MSTVRIGLAIMTLLAIGAVPLFSVPAAASAQEASCLVCHSGNLPQVPAVDAQVFKASVHGSLPCTVCHTDAAKIPHPAELQRVDPQVCSGCHGPIAQKYEASIHGRALAQGISGVANCSDCHGTHDIRAKDDPQSRVFPFNLPQTCGQCHSSAKLAEQHNIPIPEAYQSYMQSVHGVGLTKLGLLFSATCTDCHGAHEIAPASDPQSTVNPRNLPNTCGRCHLGILDQYKEGVHGQLWLAGSSQAPICNTCHPTHGVSPVTTTHFELASIAACGACHPESFKTYQESYHGQVSTLGYTGVAKCSDCHGAHLILPPSDPRSTISANHIVAACGKCHAGANANFVRFMPHVDPRQGQSPTLLHVSWIFMTALTLTVFGFFGLHTLLWAIRGHLFGRRRET